MQTILQTILNTFCLTLAICLASSWKLVLGAGMFVMVMVQDTHQYTRNVTTRRRHVCHWIGGEHGRHRHVR